MPTKEQLHEEGEVGVPGRERQRRPGGEGQVAAHQRAGVGQREHAEVEQRQRAVAVHDVRHGVVPRRERQHRRLAPALRRRLGYPQWEDEEEEEALPALALALPSSSIQNGYRMSTVWPHRYDGHDDDDDVVEFGIIRSVAAEAAARLEKKSSTNRCRGDRTR